MVFKDHKSRYKDRCLQKCCQTQPDHLLDPLRKSVNVTSRNAKHIQRSDRDLNQQDTAALEVREKHFYNSIGHQNNAENQHDPAGDCVQAKP